MEAKGFFNFSSDFRRRSGWEELYLDTDEEEPDESVSEQEDERQIILRDSDLSDGLD